MLYVAMFARVRSYGPVLGPGLRSIPVQVQPGIGLPHFVCAPIFSSALMLMGEGGDVDRLLPPTTMMMMMLQIIFTMMLIDGLAFAWTNDYQACVPAPLSIRTKVRRRDAAGERRAWLLLRLDLGRQEMSGDRVLRIVIQIDFPVADFFDAASLLSSPVVKLTARA